MQLSMLVLLMQIVMVYALIRQSHVLLMVTVPSVGVLLQDRPVFPFTRVQKMVKHVLRTLIVKQLVGMLITALPYGIRVRQMMTVTG
jgi:hypothetical protein